MKQLEKPLHRYSFDADRIFYLQYDSYREFIDDANWSGAEDRYMASRRVDDTSWRGTDTFADAISLAINGWCEGINALEFANTASILKNAINENSISLEYRVYGNYPDIPRFVSGCPQDMVCIINTQSPKRLNIVAKVGFNSAFGWKDFVEYGSKLLSIIDFLERQNIRTRVTVRVGTREKHGMFLIDVKLKDYSEFLDLNKISFALAHPSFQRRLVFSVLEKQSKEIRRYFDITQDGGYGSDPKDCFTLYDIDSSLTIKQDNIDALMVPDKLMESSNARINYGD